MNVILKSNLGFNEPNSLLGQIIKLFYYPDAVEDDEDNEFDFMKKNVCLPGGGMTITAPSPLLICRR